MSGILFWIIFFTVILNGFYIVLGLIMGRGMGKNSESYLVANRSVPIWVTVWSVIATWFSAFMFLGLYGASYRSGMGAFVQGSILIACSASFIFLGIPAWHLGRKYGYVSSADFLSDRYESKHFGLLCGIVWLVFSLAMMMTNIIGTGALFSGLTQGKVPYWFGVIFLAVVILAYLLPGGSRSLAWVDAYQGVFMTILLWVCFYILYMAAGGDMIEIVKKLIGTPNEKLLTLPGPIPQWTYGVWFFQAVFGLTWGAFPHMYQRWYSARSPKIITITALITAALGPLFFWHGAWGGPITRLLAPNLTGAASDSVLPVLIGKLSAPWFSGLLFSGVFAAIISTASGLAMGAAAIGTKDIYSAYLNQRATEKQKVLASRVTLIVFILVATLLSFKQLAFMMTLGMLFFAGGLQLAPSIYAAFYWPRANKYGAYAGTIVGILLLAIQVALGNAAISWWGLHPGLIAFMPNLVVFIVVTLFTPAPSQEVVDKFHGYLAEKLNLKGFISHSGRRGITVSK